MMLDSKLVWVADTPYGTHNFIERDRSGRGGDMKLSRMEDAARTAVLKTLAAEVVGLDSDSPLRGVLDDWALQLETNAWAWSSPRPLPNDG